MSSGFGFNSSISRRSTSKFNYDDDEDEEDTNPSDWFICNACKKLFRQKKELFIHKRLEHNIPPVQNNNNKSSSSHSGDGKRTEQGHAQQSKEKSKEKETESTTFQISNTNINTTTSSVKVSSQLDNENRKNPENSQIYSEVTSTTTEIEPEPELDIIQIQINQRPQQHSQMQMQKPKPIQTLVQSSKNMGVSSSNKKNTYYYNSNPSSNNVFTAISYSSSPSSFQKQNLSHYSPHQGDINNINEKKPGKIEVISISDDEEEDEKPKVFDKSKSTTTMIPPLPLPQQQQQHVQHPQPSTIPMSMPISMPMPRPTFVPFVPPFFNPELSYDPKRIVVSGSTWRPPYECQYQNQNLLQQSQFPTPLSIPPNLVPLLTIPRKRPQATNKKRLPRKQAKLQNQQANTNPEQQNSSKSTPTFTNKSNTTPSSSAKSINSSSSTTTNRQNHPEPDAASSDSDSDEPVIFTCPVKSCDHNSTSAGFPDHLSLERHIRWAHTDESPYSCRFPGCSKAFKDTSVRYNHENTHRDFPCLLQSCKETFVGWYSASQHFSWSHLGLTRQLSGRRLKVSDARCPIANCGAYPRQKNNLIRHLYLKHAEEELGQAVESMYVALQEPKETIKCQICEKELGKRSLPRHMKAVHQSIINEIIIN